MTERELVLCSPESERSSSNASKSSSRLASLEERGIKEGEREWASRGREGDVRGERGEDDCVIKTLLYELISYNP